MGAVCDKPSAVDELLETNADKIKDKDIKITANEMHFKTQKEATTSHKNGYSSGHSTSNK